MADVSLDLKRQINQGADRAAFDYTTSDGAGAYLRLYSLPTFSAGGWHLINSPVQTGRLPAPPGLDRGTALTTTVTITGLQSEWLPAPYAPTSTTAGEKFGFLPDSLAFLALGVPGRASATSSLSYTVQSLSLIHIGMCIRYRPRAWRCSSSGWARAWRRGFSESRWCCGRVCFWRCCRSRPGWS